MGLEEVPLQMKELGIPAWKLDKTYVEISVKSRILFLQRFAEVARKKSIIGSVAEGGVYRGEFAKYINRYFPDRNCYLFDTFEGFTDYDIEKEHGSSMLAGTDTAANHLKNVNIEEVLAKMPNRDKIILRVGRFPETAQGIDDVFAFVNLDMNLYEPTIEGLRFFYPRMSEGGVILIHDYFNSICPNIETAIDDFEHELGRSVRRMPIGDDLSMAIVK